MYRGQLKVVTMNVDDNPSTAGQLGVRAVPTFLFFKGGSVREQIVGAVARQRLVDAIQRVMAA